MKRREFIGLISGTTAASWPLVARAQQPTKRMLRVGALIGFAEDDPATQKRVAAFLKRLADLGWTRDRNVLTVNRDFTNEMALQFRVSVVSGVSQSGALVTYAPDVEDLFRRGASYVDRILRGASPADLPVQLPTKFELIVNQKTAAALDLTVPQALLAEADEVIE